MIEPISTSTSTATATSIPTAYGRANLTPKQVWIKQQLERGLENKLIGLKYKILCNERGVRVHKDYIGELLATSNSGDLGRFTLKLKDGSIYVAHLFQIEPTKDVKPKQPSKADLLRINKAENLKVIEKVLSRFNSLVNNTQESLKGEIEYLKAMVLEAQSRTNDYRHRLEDEEKRLAGLNIKNISMETLAELLKQLKAHAKIADAYLSRIGNLIIITEPLYGMDTKDKEDKNLFIGRFAFSLSFVGDKSAMNLDQAVIREPRISSSLLTTPFFHPNIHGNNLCFGSNGTEINNMWATGEIYNLVDFLITFFSVWPHDEDSNPYIDFDRYMARKEKISLSNPVIAAYFNRIVEKPMFKSKVYTGLMEEYVLGQPSALATALDEILPDPYSTDDEEEDDD